MRNILFSIGDFHVYGYGTMIALGFVAAYLMTEFRAKRYRLDNTPVFTMLILSIVFGMLSAKLMYYITIIDEIITDPKLLLNISDGFVVYGGIIGGILAVWIYCRVKHYPFLRYFDLLIPSVALAQGFGRVGCLLAGCCYGIETGSPFAVTFHTSELAPNGVALIPTQLMSSVLNFLHFWILCIIAKRTKKPGVVAACYLIFYSIGRFVLEFVRGDLERGSVGSLSTSQFISIFILAAGIVLLAAAMKRVQKEEES